MKTKTLCCLLSGLFALACASRAQNAEHHVLRATGDALMQPFPLRLMAECLQITTRSPDPAITEIAALLRGTGTDLGAAGPVLAAAERMLEHVDRLCTTAPVTLILEDLHCADEHSLLLWGRLARAISTSVIEFSFRGEA